MALSRQVALMPNPTVHPLTVQGGLMPIRGSITFTLRGCIGFTLTSSHFERGEDLPLIIMRTYTMSQTCRNQK
jgi:hypothetical protein